MKRFLLSVATAMVSASIIFLSCKGSSDINMKAVEAALKAAKENRPELERVLEHYKGDTLKYRAACFLIENMPGHFGYDAAFTAKMQGHYATHKEISVRHGWDDGDGWQHEVDAWWKDALRKDASLHGSRFVQDVAAVSADGLIRNIDLAFTAWKENTYTKDCAFEDFCQYILPYRFINGSALDSCRSVFFGRHRHRFSHP